MAIAGGGVPAKRVAIINRQLRTVGLSHNVDSLVVLGPQDAAKLLVAGQSCYIESVGGHTEQLQQILQDMGAIDAPMNTSKWLKWISVK